MSSCVHLLKNPRDKSQVATLGRLMFPGNAIDSVQSYEDVTKRPYVYLLVDLRLEIPEFLRLRGRLPEPTNRMYIQIPCVHTHSLTFNALSILTM